MLCCFTFLAFCCTFLATSWIPPVSGLITRDHIVHNDLNEHDVFLTNEDYRDANDLVEIDLESIGISVPNDPTLSANKFEGDILGISSSLSYNNNSTDLRHKQRSAVSNPIRKWPNGQIPYVLSSKYGDYSKKMFAKVFQEYAKKSCIRFVPKTNEHKDFIYIYPDDGCYSLVGRIGGRQPVSLDAGCIQFGTIIHELMHTVGFFHEQSRTDRDEYVEIIWENIDKDSKDQFDKYTTRTINDLGLTYDYGSIMHYGPYAFTKNGKRTIQSLKSNTKLSKVKPSQKRSKPGLESAQSSGPALNSGGSKMGQRDGFSEIDLKKINKLYSCQQTVVDNEEDTNEAESSDCVDKKISCTRWAEAGDCEKDRAYMLTYCPRTCRFCDKNEKNIRVGIRTTVQPSTARPTVTARPIATNGTCENKKRGCTIYASIGFCESDEEYMRQNCAKACGFCQSTSTSAPSNNRRKPTSGPVDSKTGVKPEPECENKYEYSCALWAKLGDCENHEDFMRQRCMKACGFCGIAVPASTERPTLKPTLKPTSIPTRVKCEDSYRSCRSWVQSGQCNTTKFFMKNNCAKSCGFCDASTEIEEEVDTTVNILSTTGRPRYTTTRPLLTTITRLRPTTTRQVLTTSSSETQCRDDNPNCARWAAGGFCERRGFSEFVKRTCAKSCETCTLRNQRPKLFQTNQ